MLSRREMFFFLFNFSRCSLGVHLHECCTGSKREPHRSTSRKSLAGEEERLVSLLCTVWRYASVNRIAFSLCIFVCVYVSNSIRPQAQETSCTEIEQRQCGFICGCENLTMRSTREWIDSLSRTTLRLVYRSLAACYNSNCKHRRWVFIQSILGQSLDSLRSVSGQSPVSFRSVFG